MKKYLISSLSIILLLLGVYAYAHVVGSPSAKLPPAYEAYVPESGAADQGVTDTGSITVKNLVDEIGTSKRATIILAHTGAANTTTYTLTTNETIPSNISIWMEPGAILDGAGTLTLDNPGQINTLPDQQIVRSSIDVDFTNSGIVYPEWWGIDGTADQVQFQAANNALLSGGGIFASNTYSFSATLNLSSNIHLYGEGKASAITSIGNMTTISISGGGVYPNDNRGILIEKLALYGSGTPTSGSGIYVQNAHECCFQNLWISDHSKRLFVGITLAGGAGTDSDNIIIRDNIITKTLDTSIYIYPASLGSAEEIVISGNVISYAGRNGISVYGQRNTIIGNTIEESGWHGITLSAARLTAVTGNTVCENTRCGIEIATASLDNTVVGNIVKDNDLANSSTYSGIRLVDNSLRNIVANNICQDNDKYEIYIEAGSNNNVIMGNSVYGTDRDGTIVDSGTGTRIENNFGADEIVTTASPTLNHWGYTELDSNSNGITGTLGSGQYIGQIKTIVMTDATNSSTISITNHQTSDPEVATFDAVDETGIFMWTGTEWITIFATCTFV